MSLRRFLGWESTERHEHFDVDGTLTGYTIVTREPEYDDKQRQAVLDRLAYKRQIHHGCGNHVADSMNPTVSRTTGHYSATCEDCRAIEHDRKAWHKSQGHSDEGSCACDDEVFFIESRDPLPAHMLKQLLASKPDVAGWLRS